METVTPQRSGWLRSAPDAPAFPPLAQDLAADTVIIGAGYAGLNAALRLAERGERAVVLEAHEPGFGASGRNGGQVIAGLKYDPAELADMFGEARGRALAAFAGDAPANTFDLIARYQLQCHARQCGWLQPAVDDATVALIARRARMWRELGVAARIVDAAETHAATGTDFYTGGWIDPRGGQLQPLAYARELARVAAAQGAHIFTQSPAMRLERAGDGWVVAVNGHAVRAASVLVCTNGYTDRLLPRLRRSYVAASSIICATRPLPAALRQQIMPSGTPVSDARRLLNYMSLDPQGRFMIGARGSFGLHEPESHILRACAAPPNAFSRRRGGSCGKTPRGGRFALTADHLPHLHNPAPGLYTVIGCNGRGVAMLSQLGRLVADLGSGAVAAENSPVPVTPVAPIPFHSLRRIGLEAMGAWYRMRIASGCEQCSLRRARGLVDQPIAKRLHAAAAGRGPDRRRNRRSRPASSARRAAPAGPPQARRRPGRCDRARRPRPGPPPGSRDRTTGSRATMRIDCRSRHCAARSPNRR